MNKKEAYKEKLQSQLDVWDAKINVLKTKAEAGARRDYQETVEDLQKKRSNAKDNLQKLQNASENAWEDLKAGLEQSWSELGDAVDSATSRFKE